VALLVLFVAVGLLLSGLSLPLIFGKVGPNAWYGFRVPATLDDPDTWYRVNAFAAKGLLWVGLGTCAAAVLLYLVPGIELPTYAALVGAVVLGGLAVSLILSFRYLAAVTGREGGDPDED
jgi:SdpI/YfhL protein family